MSDCALICELILFISAIFSYIKNRDIFHPSVIVSFLWTIIIFAYNHYPHKLYPLSDLMYIMITGWALCFSICANITASIKYKGIGLCCFKIKNFYFNDKLYYSLLCLNSLLIYFLISQTGGAFELSELRDSTIDEGLPIHIKLLYYVNQFTIIYVLCLILLSNRKENLIKISIITLILILTLILKTNKTGFILFFIGLFYIFHKKRYLTFKRFLYGLVVLLILIVITTISRGDTEYSSFDWKDYIIIYLLSPLPAMDMFLRRELTIYSGSWGSSTFKFFYVILALLGISYQQTGGGGWVSVPLPTNVYTALRSFYLDFGDVGVIIFALILGCIWGYFYSMQKRNYPVYVLFYGSMIYSLFVQFFSDYFFGFFSITIQSFIFAWIICMLSSNKQNRKYK